MWTICPQKGPRKMIEAIRRCGIIPVIKLENVNKAGALADALYAGGIDLAEVTFRAAGADRVIEAIRTRRPEMIVGAGSVITLEEAKRAVSAGASFLVSPGFDEEIVEYALENQVMPLPGIVTPSEAIRAIKLGIDTVKFFPAEQYGGIKTIKALRGPFPNLSFVPTGGISLSNLEEYLDTAGVTACGGSFMVKTDLINENRWETIRDISRQAREIVKAVRERKEENHA